jgi:hypothetical protein
VPRPTAWSTRTASCASSAPAPAEPDLSVQGPEIGTVGKPAALRAATQQLLLLPTRLHLLGSQSRLPLRLAHAIQDATSCDKSMLSAADSPGSGPLATRMLRRQTSATMAARWSLAVGSMLAVARARIPGGEFREGELH